MEQSRTAARIAKEVGIEISGLFMFGMMGDTKESLSKLYKFALELEIEHPQFNMAFRPPGSIVYDKYSNLLQHNNGEKKILRAYVRNAYLKFYLRPNYLFRQLKKIKTIDKFILLIKIFFDLVFYQFF